MCPSSRSRDGLQTCRTSGEQVFQAWEQRRERLQVMGREQLFLRKCGRLEPEIWKAQEAGALAQSLPSAPLLSSPQLTLLLPASAQMAYQMGVGADCGPPGSLSDFSMD